MANREKGELRVQVGGEAYTLRPSFNALCELEDLVDKKIDEILLSVSQGRLSGLRAVVWSYLYDHHGEEIKTLKDASLWIERAGGADQVLAIINELQALNTDPEPEVAGDAKPNPPVAQAGTGEPSSPRLVVSA